MDFGIKVSKEGKDVTSAVDKDLIYSSEFKTFRIAQFGSGSITATLGTPQTVTINHVLGYRPAFLVFTEIYDVFIPGVSTGHYLCPYTDPLGGDASISPYCSTTTLKIRYGGDHAPNGTVLNYRYFIFYNKAKT